MHLILLRHTATAAGSSYCYGDQDVPLATTADADMAAVVARLPAVDHIITSPLSRCTNLARVVARTMNLQIESDTRLQEMNFGDWQGLKWDDVPRAGLDEWAADFERAQPHGGESVLALRERVCGFLQALSERFSNHQRLLLVTHAGVIRATLALLGQSGAAMVTASAAGVDHSEGAPYDERNVTISYGQWIDVDYNKVMSHD